MRGKNKKDSISVNACIGKDLFQMLEALCEVTGQSKTVAVERAIRAYCREQDAAREPGQEGGTA